MPKISVAIATYNEESNIKDCLKSLSSLKAEVIVVDGSSTDQTLKIAKELGAKVIKTQNRAMFHTNKNMAIDACHGEWILVLDADERVDSKLAREIKEIASRKWTDKDPAGYYLKRKNLFLTRFLKKGGQYPDPVIRFFKKGSGRHPEVSVHEQIKIKGQVGWLENDLIHLANPTFTRYLTRENRYSTLEAENLAKEKVALKFSSGFKYLLSKPIKTFLSIFIRHKGFYDGFSGFIFAFFSGLHHFLAYVKYWEKKHAKEKIDIKKDWL